jgi:hypothetical protein
VRDSIASDIYGHILQNMQDEAAELIDGLVTPTEVKLDGSIYLNNAFHMVAPSEVKMQHNLNDDP